MKDNFGNKISIGDLVREIGSKKICVVESLHPAWNACTITHRFVTAGCQAENLVRLTDAEAMLYKLENA